MRKLAMPENQKFTFFSYFWRELFKLEETKFLILSVIKKQNFLKYFIIISVFFHSIMFFFLYPTSLFFSFSEIFL